MLRQLLAVSGLFGCGLFNGSWGVAAVLHWGFCDGLFGLGRVAVGFAVRSNLAFATFFTFALAFDSGYLAAVCNFEHASIGQGVVTLWKWDALPLVVDDVRFGAFAEVVGVGVNDSAVFEYGFCKFGPGFLRHREVDVETLEDFLHSF